MRRSTLSIATLLVVGLGSALALSDTRHPKPAADPGVGGEQNQADRGESTVAEPTLAEGTKDPAPAAPAPLSLTASDGTGLKLVSLDVRAALEDPLGLTELRLTFENVQDRVLEGNFKIMLPPGAALSRFAMKIDDVWQEAEVVEKQAARRAYEDFLHRKQDPALLEQAPGNEFAARVFPIPARGRKEIIVTYSQALDARADYTLFLQGLPRLDKLAVRVNSSGVDKPIFQVDRANFVPGSDLVVPSGRFARRGGLRAGKYMMARVVPIPKGNLPPDTLGSSVFLVDSSASRALGLAEQTKLLSALVEALPPGSRVSVLAFDQTTEVIFDGDKSEFGAPALKKLEARGALGASNLAAALRDASQYAKSRDDKPRRLVLLSDGVATAGDIEASQLRSKLESVTDSPIRRLDAVVVGGLRDESMLTQLVRGNLAQDGVVVDSKLGVAEVKRRLDGSTRSKIAVHVDGATWVHPDRIDGVQPGDEVRVFAEIPEGKVPQIRLGDGEPLTPQLREVETPLLERAWASAKIESLQESPPSGDKDAGRRAIIALSTKHRVISPFTSMLVLETDADYKRFDIDRKSKLDILTIDGSKIAVAQQSRGPKDGPAKEKEEDEKTTTRDRARRSEAATTAAAPAAPQEAAQFGIIGLLNSGAGGDPNAASARGNMWGDQVGDAFGVGGLGLSGVGEGGGGRAGAGAFASGGEGEGIGLGSMGTLGHGSAPSGGAGTGTGQGFGSGAGRLGGAHRSVAPTIRISDYALRTSGTNQGIPAEVIQRIVRQNFGRIRLCFENAQRTDPAVHGVVPVRMQIDTEGGSGATVQPGPGVIANAGLRACVQRALDGLAFPAPLAPMAVRFQLLLGEGVTALQLPPVEPASPRFRGSVRPNWHIDEAPRSVANDVRERDDSDLKGATPYTGRFQTVMSAIGEGKKDKALAEAKDWQHSAPGDVLSLVALGEAQEALGDKTSAARAYGSILELFSFRADSRRFAGERLERLGTPFAYALAADAYNGAVEQRPDHPSSHRLLAYSLAREGRFAEAMNAIEKGVKRKYPEGRFAGVERVLKEDMALIAAAFAKAEPTRRKELEARLAEQGAKWEGDASVRFVLVWETDANDVDFHIRDGKGGHAYFSAPELPSGGSLYADVTTGYGPECFTIRGPAASRAYPYKLSAHYYSRGPMGYGMGKLQIIEHDGKGGLSFEERPFVIMQDQAFVNLGTVKGALSNGKS